MTEYIIKKAINEMKKIDIIYMKENGITERQIKPIKLSDGILEAYCYMRRSIRKFKMDNILGASFIKHKNAG